MLSVFQMRNMNMTLEMSSEAVLLTCPMLGMKGRPCPMSTSHHLVINLADIRRTQKKSLPTRGHMCVFTARTPIGTSSTWVPHPLQVVRPVKENTESTLTTSTASERKSDPPPGLPAPIPKHKEEDTSEVPRERVPMIVEEERKETEAKGGKGLLYRKIQDKPSDKTELYKLHLKHYHMSPSSFRHRTSELHLSPKIYELYEQVAKECEHCQNSAVRPVKSRVSGPRANFLAT